MTCILHSASEVKAISKSLPVKSSNAPREGDREERRQDSFRDTEAMANGLDAWWKAYLSSRSVFHCVNRLVAQQSDEDTVIM
jgi:hypothetical protein